MLYKNFHAYINYRNRTEYFYKISSGTRQYRYHPYYANVYHDRPVELYKKVINPSTGLPSHQHKYEITVPSKPLNVDNLWVVADFRGESYRKYNPSSSTHVNMRLFTKDSYGNITQAYPNYPNLRTPLKPVKITNYK